MPTALIPPSYLDCVVALGIEEAEEGVVHWVASGFLYAYRVKRPGRARREYLVYLVTNRHVLEGTKTAVLRFNPRGEEPAREYQIDLVEKDGSPAWVGHSNPRVDVAVVLINYHLLRRHAMQVGFFAADVHAVRVKQMKAMDVSEGDAAYVLGFPMGLVGERRNAVIVRSGTVARIQDTLHRASREFLLDTFVFPGNSGGPVLLKPKPGQGRSDEALLAGVIASYVPYQDVAVSMQTDRPRVIFEENSGLAAAYPMDFVDQAIRLHLRRLQEPAARRTVVARSER